MVFIANTTLIPEDAVPTTWKELADWDVDTYGKIAIADPTSSGSAFTQLCTMLFLYGEESDDYAAGWDFVSQVMPKLEVKNSSSRPTRTSSPVRMLSASPLRRHLHT